jgi:hypothetical protein
MVAQERAKRIIAAWVAGSADGMKIELQDVFAGPLGNSRTHSTLEAEEQELLECVASDLYLTMGRRPEQSNRLQANLSLLQHLSNRSAQSLTSSCAA